MPSGKQRESWTSKTGFVLAAAGSAIGLGNLWKFPYITWQNGGGSFILLYLVCILLVGLPIMIAEIGMGKLSQKNPVGAFKFFAGMPSPFRFVGFLGVLIAFLILSYYSVVAGWSIEYSMASIEKKFESVPDHILNDFLEDDSKIEKLQALAFEEKLRLKLTDNFKRQILAAANQDVSGNTEDLNEAYNSYENKELIQLLKDSGKLPELQSAAFKEKQSQPSFEAWANEQLMADYSSKLFGDFVSNPARTLPWHTMFMLITVIIVLSGIKKGIEKAVKAFMPILFLLLIFLVVNSLRLDKEQEGINFILFGDGTPLSGVAFLEALGHAFFTLSLGLGALMTYGSYLGKKADIVSNSIWIVFLDTLIALLACMLIFPIIFVYNLQPESGGIGILFTTIPLELFKFPNGAYFSLIFYGMIFLAAITSAISLLEVVVSYIVDELQLSRKKAVFYSAALIFGLGIPSAISPGGFLTPLDNLVTRVLLPTSGFFIAIFAGYRIEKKLFRKEFTSQGYSPALFELFLALLKYVSPFLVLLVMVGSLVL